MANAVVSFLLGKLELFIRRETALLSGVGDDVEFIKQELERINAFLRVTDTIEEVDPQLSIWINEVRNLAFDIEDVVDEFNLRLAHNDRGESSMRKTIRGFKNLKYRHRIASKFQCFKSRVISISDGHERYKLLDFPNQGSSSTARNSTWQERRGDALLLDDDDLVGTDEPKRKLVNWLVEEEVPAFRVISVVGMGGLGKTTLVKKVYDDVARQKHFKSHAWITVSQSFKLEELLKNIICQLYKESMEATPQEVDTMDSQGLKEALKKYLQDRRYLIVLDDVWEQGAWDAIKHAFPKKHGNRVMLTTRNHEVANASCFEFEGEVYLLEPLSWEMSWQLFCKKTFHGRDCPSYLEGIAKQILKRCEGLPLAIVTLSGLLAMKNQNKIHEWEMVKGNLGVELENDKLISMKKILSLSYYDLPFHLKACLLHISHIPEDYEFVCRRLVKLWIAEEFVDEVTGKTMEEVGESYLNELLHRSLLQVVSRDAVGAVLVCRIHDMLREVVLSKCKDQSFAMIVNEKNKEWPTKARRLAIQYTLGDWDGRNNNNHKLLGGLRSLMLFCIDDFRPLKSLFVKLDLKLVKVLDLSWTNLEEFPNGITKLYHLRFLNLNYTNVSVIPVSIGKLLNLVTLSLFCTRVTNLPSTIRNLGRLRHLLVCSVENLPGSVRKVHGFDAKSAGIGYLHSVQVLWCIELKGVAGDDGEIIKEIGKLRQLRDLRILNLKREDGMALCSSLDKLPYLRKLEIAASVVDVDGEEEILELHSICSPPKFLQQITLIGRLEKVPHWISVLNNLAALWLIGSRINNNNNILKAVKGLPNLVNLHLDCAFEGNELRFEVGGFQKLNTLWLSDLQALTRVVVDDGALPLLEKLIIQRCVVMDILPLGIQNLATLKLLRLQDVSNTSIETIDTMSKLGGREFWKIQHIQQVNVYSYNKIERKWIELPL